MFRKIFKGFVLTCLILFLLFLVIAAVLVSKYNRWNKDIFKTNNSKIVFCLSNLYTGERAGGIGNTEIDTKERIEGEVEKKIMNFILSDSRIDFVVFTPPEVLHVLSSNIQKGEHISIEDICLVPSIGIWQVYMKYQIGSFDLPWVVMDVVKDNRETAEIYVNEIKVGNIKIPEPFSKKINVDINKGIVDAIIMLNENRFLGRIIENIELLEERVVFKGSI